MATQTIQLGNPTTLSIEVDYNDDTLDVLEVRLTNNGTKRTATFYLDGKDYNITIRTGATITVRKQVLSNNNVKLQMISVEGYTEYKIGFPCWYRT